MAYADHGDLDRTATALSGSVGDYLALLKPRVMSLVVFTALVGIVIAPGEVHPIIAFASLVAIAVGAGAAGALNMWFDADIDGKMSRTRLRPIPRGSVEPGEALVLGLILSVGSVTVLGLAANWLAAALLAFTIFFYVAIYTMWLKRRTPQNIVIGGAAGALPPVIGWAAATGSIGYESLVLFLIIFLWTPPHFWALSLYKADDYAKAGVPMLPVVAGFRGTQRQIMVYSALLAAAGVSPWAIGLAGPLYLATALVLGGAFIAIAWRLALEQTEPEIELWAKRLFAFSILYLFLLFSALLAETMLGMTGAVA